MALVALAMVFLALAWIWDLFIAAWRLLVSFVPAQPCILSLITIASSIN